MAYPCFMEIGGFGSQGDAKCSFDPCASRTGALDRVKLRQSYAEVAEASTFKAECKSRRRQTKRGKGTKIMAVADSGGLPVAVCAESATSHEVTLVQQTLAEIVVAEPLRRLIGDNAYDLDRLDRELAETGVEMSAPHRSNRKHHTQDGLRRYRRRWKIERLFAWLQNCRRLTVRWEHSLENLVGTMHLACAIILLGHL